ncbi:MAG: hypothetical protein WAU24_00910 [Chitinophagaceae bacterium]
MKKISLFSCFTFVCILFALKGISQIVELKGTVYDYFNKQPLYGVIVYSNSSAPILTDTAGRFIISTSLQDSVWFSYFSKNTKKYPVDTIRNKQNFEIALYVDVAWLPGIKVNTKSYREDSLQNRNDYAKIFNFKKPGISIVSPSPSYTPGFAVGFDLDELINIFRFRRNNQLSSFQQRLIREEQDKYIDHRFTENLVEDLTGIDKKYLLDFMQYCRPDYYLLLSKNDLEFGYYIQQRYKEYLQNKINQ